MSIRTPLRHHAIAPSSSTASGACGVLREEAGDLGPARDAVRLAADGALAHEQVARDQRERRDRRRPQSDTVRRRGRRLEQLAPAQPARGEQPEPRQVARIAREVRPALGHRGLGQIGGERDDQHGDVAATERAAAEPVRAERDRRDERREQREVVAEVRPPARDQADGELARPRERAGGRGRGGLDHGVAGESRRRRARVDPQLHQHRVGQERLAVRHAPEPLGRDAGERRRNERAGQPAPALEPEHGRGGEDGCE